jgi:hypothetical protein
MNLLAFQQFLPVEHPSSKGCIWCGKKERTNRAHIISRKLTMRSHNSPTLSFNVFELCNSKCGQLEEWVLRFTPLSWLRLMLYVGAGEKGTSHHVPSCFFSELLQEWVVFYLDTKIGSYIVGTQFINAFSDHPILLTQLPQDQHEELFKIITTAIFTNSYHIDIRLSLPETFTPRFLIEGNKVILIARTKDEVNVVSSKPKQLNMKAISSKYTQLDNKGQVRHVFYWSKENWTRFCAKSALETLCLFEGGDRCLSPAFNTVREFVLNRNLQKGKEILFDEHGPIKYKDFPNFPAVDLTNGQNAPRSILGIVPRCEPGMHLIAIYEIKGWILASIVFAGFPATILVLGGPDEHLSDFYQLIYDEQEAAFDFIRLAYDCSLPVIPLPIPGNHFKDIVETYKLIQTNP